MNRLKLRFTLPLVLVGCGQLGAPRQSAFLDPGGTGGSDLSDGEGGQPQDCCVKKAEAPFEGPSWVTIAEPGAVAPCPEPTTEGFTAHAELQPIEHTCGECSCSPASCSLPEGIHTNAAKCPGDGSFTVPLGPDPADGWEGVCSEDGAIPAGLQCGGAPCAQSVTVPAPTIAPCKPTIGPAKPFPAPAWGKVAQECKFDMDPGEGCATGSVCVPVPPAGAALCLHVQGEAASCPDDYPVRLIFYLGVKDDRDCEACECGPPEGGQCMAVVSLFSDNACSAIAGAVVVTDQEGGCVDVVSGTALGSLEASFVTDVPGSCVESGGAPIGGLLPAKPLTLCCQAEPEPPG